MTLIKSMRFQTTPVYMKKRTKGSAFACPYCDNRLTFEEERIICCWDAVTCTVCRDDDNRLTIENLKVYVLWDSRQVAKNADLVFKAEWYHSTNKANWIDDVLNNPYGMYGATTTNPPVIHVGSLEAAQDRAAHEDYKYMYKVTFVQGTSVDSRLGEDITSFPQTMKELRHSTDSDILRYVNRWESPGSVSLLVDPRTVIAERVK